MTARTLAVISAGLSQPSSTRLLADRLSGATNLTLRESGIDVAVTNLELRGVAADVTNMMLTGFASPRLAAAIETITSADGLIATTPIFTTSYSGLFKSFVDVLDPQSLAGMPVLLGATGGTERHSLRSTTRCGHFSLTYTRCRCPLGSTPHRVTGAATSVSVPESSARRGSSRC